MTDAEKAYQEYMAGLAKQGGKVTQLDAPEKGEEIAVIHTTMGDIKVKFFPEAAPKAVENFKTLAKDGYYDGLTFHRIMEGYMMQGGDPEGTGFGGAENTIVGEFKANGYDNPLSHTRGAVSMARSQAYNSASSQFFIVQRNFKSWDGQYAVFGYVTEGMEIVDKVCADAEPIDGNGTIPADKQPVMTSVKIRTEPAA